MHVLMVSDNLELGRIWIYALQQRGLMVNEASLCTDGLLYQDEHDHMFDLALIDIYDLQHDGAGLCRTLRAHSRQPILILAPTGDEAFLLKTYQAGADECVTKPISPALLLAKVDVWLRHADRQGAVGDGGRQIGLRLDPNRRVAIRPNGSSVRLTNLEFRLMRYMMSHAPQVVTTEQIIDYVWGDGGGVEDSRLKNLVYRLRRKIDLDPRAPSHIQTVAGEGYLLQVS